MMNTTKWKHLAAATTVCLTAAFVIVLVSTLSNLGSLLKPENDPSFWRFDALQNIPVTLGALAVLAITVTLLFSVWKTETPFEQRNIRRIWCIAIVTISIEPVQYLLNALLNYYRPALPDGYKAVYVISYGGILITLGLAVLCLSFLFEYGAYLQNQYDETL